MHFTLLKFSFLCGMSSVLYCTVWYVFSVVLHCVACVRCCTVLCGMCSVLYCTVWHVFSVVLHCVVCVQ